MDVVDRLYALEAAQPPPRQFRWRMSPDIADACAEADGQHGPVKTGRALILGYPVVVDALLPPDSLAVEDAPTDKIPDSLDAAWAEAEAALPPGHTMDLTLENHVDGGRYLAWTMRHTDTAIIRGEASTPAAALRALAAKLRNR